MAMCYAKPKTKKKYEIEDRIVVPKFEDRLEKKRLEQKRLEEVRLEQEKLKKLELEQKRLELERLEKERLQMQIQEQKRKSTELQKQKAELEREALRQEEVLLQQGEKHLEHFLHQRDLLQRTQNQEKSKCLNLIASMPNISVKAEGTPDSKTEKEMDGKIQPDVISLLDESILENSKNPNGETFIEEIFSADATHTTERLGEIFSTLHFLPLRFCVK